MISNVSIRKAIILESMTDWDCQIADVKEFHQWIFGRMRLDVYANTRSIYEIQSTQYYLDVS